MFRDCELNSGGCWSNWEGSRTLSWIHMCLSKIPVARVGLMHKIFETTLMWTIYKHFLASVTSISSWTKLGHKESGGSYFFRNVGKIYNSIWSHNQKDHHLKKKTLEWKPDKRHPYCFDTILSYWKFATFFTFQWSSMQLIKFLKLDFRS